jgi:hypothetical protein
VGRRGGNTVTRETLGGGIAAVARDELGEDPRHDRFGFGVEIEAVQSLAVRRLGGVGVRSRVHDLVPVRRASAEEPALVGGLRSHGGLDADLDPVPLALAHPTEHRHDQVVGFVLRVDRPAHLRHPERDAVMVEQRDRQTVLIAVEGAVRLADHHRGESALGVL